MAEQTAGTIPPELAAFKAVGEAMQTYKAALALAGKAREQFRAAFDVLGAALPLPDYLPTDPEAARDLFQTWASLGDGGKPAAG